MRCHTAWANRLIDAACDQCGHALMLHATDWPHPPPPEGRECLWCTFEERIIRIEERLERAITWIKP